MSVRAASDPQDWVLLPEVRVRRAFAGAVRLTLLVPPYPALGIGSLRVLRVREGDAIEIVAGYDRYERLPTAAPAR